MKFVILIVCNLWMVPKMKNASNHLINTLSTHIFHSENTNETECTDKRPTNCFLFFHLNLIIIMFKKKNNSDSFTSVVALFYTTKQQTWHQIRRLVSFVDEKKSGKSSFHTLGEQWNISFQRARKIHYHPRVMFLCWITHYICTCA